MGSSGFGGGIGGGGNLTAEFPDDRQPEKKETVTETFDQKANDDYQTQMQKEIEALEAQRQTPELQMDHTIGGSVEQAVHTEIHHEHEAEIKELHERMQDHQNSRTR